MHFSSLEILIDTTGSAITTPLAAVSRRAVTQRRTSQRILAEPTSPNIIRSHMPINRADSSDKSKHESQRHR